MLNYQSSALCFFLEVFVMVRIAAAAILNAHDVIVIVHHFVKQGSADLFDRARKRSCSYVDFVAAANSRNPCIIV